MPTSKEIASELWLHVNSPETLDEIVGANIAKLRREARLDELVEYQNERKEIDDTVETYLNSPTFENYKQTFLDIDDRDSPELEQVVRDMSDELHQAPAEQQTAQMSQRGREQSATQIASDVESLGQRIQQSQQRNNQELKH